MADRSHIIMPCSSNSSTTTSSPDTAARHPTGPLKCPRCDSTNTKFCYYNNYSLAQPRHFCKACKRYWTRGGTLRNVPVGGGCRKNKRMKKTPTYTDSPTLTLPPPPISSNANFSNTADINPNFFYNLSNNISYPNLQQRVQEYYDLQLQTKATLGFGFGFNPTTEDQYPHQFGANLTDSTAVSSAVKDYHYPLFGSSSVTAASLLVSSLKQPRKIDDYQILMNYNDQQLNGSLGQLLNQVKVEGEANNSFDWQLSCEAPFDAASAAATATSAPVDSSFMYWNGVASGSWPEANYGSSITPLI